MAVYRDGPTSGPTVLAVHGYPDNASVWDGVSALLADRFQVVRYDVRGAGASDRPPDRERYRLDYLVADLEAVCAATSPSAPVHLLAHDWGSIQAWAAISDHRLAGRIASFTSISGPCLAQVRPWLAASLRRRRFGRVGRQLLHSYYLVGFQLPLLPELLWRSRLVDRILDRTDRREGVAGAGSASYRRALADKVNGLQLYRANLFGRGSGRAASAGGSGAGRSRTGSLTTEVPVQVLAPKSDPFVTQALQLQAPVPYTKSLYRRPVPGGHWLPVTNPGLVAQACTELVELVEFGRPAAGLVS
ncbi:MAG: alpha/beta fold hydrolase [Jatrophihabitantaceae bacterium]